MRYTILEMQERLFTPSILKINLHTTTSPSIFKYEYKKHIKPSASVVVPQQLVPRQSVDVAMACML